MLTLEQCETRGVYRIQARNFFVAVYNGNGGFIGIREKFGDRYLFTEYHHDLPHYGTVRPIEKVGQLPEDIELIEMLVGSWCSEHDRLSEWRPNEPGGHTGWWYHLDDNTALGKHDIAHSKPYDPLFEALVPYEAAENARYESEQ